MVHHERRAMYLRGTAHSSPEKLPFDRRRSGQLCSGPQQIPYTLRRGLGHLQDGLPSHALQEIFRQLLVQRCSCQQDIGDVLEFKLPNHGLRFLYHQVEELASQGIQRQPGVAPYAANDTMQSRELMRRRSRKHFLETLLGDVQPQRHRLPAFEERPKQYKSAIESKMICHEVRHGDL